jgi:ABC-type nitrate/sulfonate/bicarbonate transport system permease component
MMRAEAASDRRLGPRWWAQGARSFGRRLAEALVVPALFVIVWWLVVEARLYPQAFLPSPVAVLSALIEWVTGRGFLGNPAPAYAGNWFDSVFASAQRVLIGYAIGSLIGIALGGLLGYVPIMRRVVEPFINMLRAIPIIGWLPLSLVFFGLGAGSAIFLVALGVVFPVIVATMGSVSSVQPSLLRVGQMVGANRAQLTRHIVLPAALPGIIIGLRVAMGFAWILVIVAEWVAVRRGLGFTLLDAYNFLRYDYVIAAMISVGLVGFLSDRLVWLLTRPALRWHSETTIGG